MTYHINKHGVPAKCYAQVGNCPLGGTESHFDSQENAQAYADALNEMYYGYYTEISNEPFSEIELKKQFPHLNLIEIKQVKDYLDREIELHEFVEDLKSDKTKSSDEYFDRVQIARQMALDKYKSIKDLPIDYQEAKDIVEKEIPPVKPWASDPNYSFHPDITSNTFWRIGKVMSAYSGKNQWDIKREVETFAAEENISLQQATESYWKTLKQRTDKPFVSLDLETANPVNDKSIDYDNGQLTYILEIGGVKTYPDGRTEEISILYDVPKEFKDIHGTGFQSTHNIAPEDVEGRSEFTSDEENQKKIIDFLDGSVVIAHNAFFEERQLTNSLRGFKRKLDNREIETLDTMNFCKFLVPESARNTNEAFVEAAGLEYKGAHRAHADAVMTLNAFNILKDNR